VQLPVSAHGGIGRQASRRSSIKIAVGDYGAIARDPQLPTVGVTGEHEIGAVADKAVQHPAVRGMHNTDRQVGVGIEGTGDLVVAIATDVRIIDSAKLKGSSVGLDDGRGVRQVLPTHVGEAVDEVLPRQHRSVRFALGRLLEVQEGVDGPRGEVVIAAQDKCARQIQQRVQAVDHVRNRIVIAQEVTRGDHEVGLQVTKGLQPKVLLALTWHEMQIGQMQDAQIRLTEGQHGDLGSPQREVLGFPVRIDQPDCSQRRRARHQLANAHGSMVTLHCSPQQSRVGHNADMTSLKAQLQADLTTAMKARDQLSASTLRMALTAITNEEVSGKQARELSDDEVLTVLGREAKRRREAAEAYEAAERLDLAAKERDELTVLSGYLPEGLSIEAVQAIIDAAVAQAAADGLVGGAAMGAVMKIVQPQVRGRADGGAVAASVKAALGMA